MAIDRQTVIVGDLTGGNKSTFWAIDLNETLEIDLRESLAPMPGKAANYLLGVARQFIRRGHSLPNMDIAITSTVPMAAGLSSSAAVEVAFATLLEEILQVSLQPLDKALLCQRAEWEFPGTVCGIMDMLISILAVEDHALLIDCRSNEVVPVRLPDAAEAALLVVDTKVKRNLANSKYSERRKTCSQAAQILQLPSLRDATTTMLKQSNLNSNTLRKALHVVSENDRTVFAAAALGSGDVHRFGELMFQSHESLRELFEVSCSELDAVVNAAQEMAKNEVFGARMTGAGFGGCAIVLCRADALTTVRNHVQNKFTAAFGHPCNMFSVAAAGPAQALTVG